MDLSGVETDFRLICQEKGSDTTTSVSYSLSQQMKYAIVCYSPSPQYNHHYYLFSSSLLTFLNPFFGVSFDLTCCFDLTCSFDRFTTSKKSFVVRPVTVYLRLRFRSFLLRSACFLRDCLFTCLSRTLPWSNNFL